MADSSQFVIDCGKFSVWDMYVCIRLASWTNWNSESVDVSKIPMKNERE